jgi:tape measure domain-containing protein
MADKNKIEIILSAVDHGLKSTVDGTLASMKGLSAGSSKATADMRALAQGSQQASAGMQTSQRSADTLETTLKKLAGVVAGVFSINQIQGFVESFARSADAMSNMDSKLLLTAKNTADYAAAQKTVVDIAKEAHQGLGEVTTLYTRMALATENLNVSQKQLAEVTKTVALATAMSGAAASESSAGLQQFAQAMASNRLGGDELRSVLENMPMLTKVFVDAAGGSIAKLREMAEEGKLTTQWMLDAILKAAPAIEQQAKAMPMTVEKAMTDLKNETSKYIDNVNQSTGATRIMVGSIQLLGNNLDLVAKGGFVVLTTTISAFVGKGLAAAIAGTGTFIAGLTAVPASASAVTLSVSSTARAMNGYGMAASIAAAQTAANTAAQAAAGTVASRLLPAIFGLINPITAVTTVLGLGAAAWALWGEKADNELDKAKGRVAELKRLNQMIKEQSDPSIRLQQTAKNIESAQAEVARLEKELQETYRGENTFDLKADISLAEGKLEQARQKLKTYEQEHAETQKNIALSTEQRGAKEIAAEMSVTEAINKQNEERRKATASQLENDLAEIAKKRDAELKAAEAQFKAEDLIRVKAAINSRFDAEAAVAKKEAADKAAKAAETAANKAERAARKEEKAALNAAHLQAKIAAEKLRNSTADNLLSLERERIEAGRLPTALARAKAEMDIARRVMAEKIALQKQEAAVIEADPKSTQADILKAKRDVLQLQVEADKEAAANMAQVAREKLAETEQAWRRGTGSVEEYRAAVVAAGQAGVLFAEQVNDKLIASGGDLGAALALGFRNAREKMQTDAEMMMYIGENLGDQLAGGLSSAWDSYITKTATAKEALIDFARSTLSWLSQIILKQMLLNAIGFGSTTAADGTVTAGTGLLGMLGFAAGGSVPGWSPNRTADNIPAWLTAREFVQPVASVDYYGEGFMELIRRRLIPRNVAHALAGGTLPRIPSGNRLAQGGMAAAAPETTVKTGDVKLHVTNVLHPDLMGDYMRTPRGEAHLLNFIRRNGSAIRASIGG